MKKLFTSLLLVFVISVCFAQEEGRITFSGVTIQNSAFSSYSINPSLNIAIAEKFNLHYSLGIGIRGNHKFYMHMPGLAPIGIVLLANSGDIHFLGMLGLILFFFPEGISYDITVNEKWAISPFVDINSAETYAYGDNNNFRYKFSLDGGIATRYYFNRNIFGQFYTSAKVISSKGWGVSAGLGIGFAW